MAKYHIKKDGTPGLCNAKGPCPLGGSESHFNSQEEAQNGSQKRMEQHFGVISDTLEQKNSSSHEKLMLIEEPKTIMFNNHGYTTVYLEPEELSKRQDIQSKIKAHMKELNLSNEEIDEKMKALNDTQEALMIYENKNQLSTIYSAMGEEDIDENLSEKERADSYFELSYPEDEEYMTVNLDDNSRLILSFS